MAYHAYIVKVENLRPHPNADKLQILTVFGNDTCVSLDVKVGDLGIYFPCDGQLSEEFAEVNNLVRKKDDAGNNIGGYLDPNRRITAIKLRGEKSDGIYLPIYCLDAFCDTSTLGVGDTIDVINGKQICCKYIPPVKNRTYTRTGNKTRKRKIAVAPLFREHADTEQLAYNLSAFRPGDEIEITLKMHGTSQRTGYLPVVVDWYNENPFWNRGLHTIDPKKPMGRLAKKIYDRAMATAIPVYDWGYVSGTRRTVLENYDGGYYGSNEFREQHSKIFEGKLWKGETVYYEVVGFTHTGASIMGNADNKKLNDKEFIKQYGKETVFSYGCSPGHLSGKVLDKEIANNESIIYPQSDIYVYRMTMTNEDGDVVEYTPDFVRYRCEQMGVKTVPVMWKGIIPSVSPSYAGEWIKDVAEEYYDGPDPIGKTHVREGVVVRIINRPKFTAYKHKNFSFKVLEGIVKLDADAPDMEEIQDTIE